MSCVVGALLYLVSFFCSHIHGLPVGETKNSSHSIGSFMRFPSEDDWRPARPVNPRRAVTPPTTEPPFVFPDDIPKPPKVSKGSPDCAKDSTYCESVDDYPLDYLQVVLNNNIDEYKLFMGIDRVQETGINHRIDAVDETPLCPSVEDIVFPKKAKTKDEKWLFVVNHDNFYQGVRIEKCLPNGGNGDSKRQCAFTEQFPLGYVTTCKQKYIYRKLLALDENNKTTTDTFVLPSCCSCAVKQVSLAARFGGSRFPTTPVPSTSKPKES